MTYDQTCTEHRKESQNSETPRTHLNRASTKPMEKVNTYITTGLVLHRAPETRFEAEETSQDKKVMSKPNNFPVIPNPSKPQIQSKY